MCVSTPVEALHGFYARPDALPVPLHFMQLG